MAKKQKIIVSLSQNGDAMKVNITFAPELVGSAGWDKLTRAEKILQNAAGKVGTAVLEAFKEEN